MMAIELVMPIAMYHAFVVFASTIPLIVSVTEWNDGFPSISGGSAAMAGLCICAEVKYAFVDNADD